MICVQSFLNTLQELCKEFAGVFIMLIDQYSSSNAGGTKLRILMACWLLAILVLVNAYKGCILSVLVQPKYTILPKTFDDLKAQQWNYDIVHLVLVYIISRN